MNEITTHWRKDVMIKISDAHTLLAKTSLKPNEYLPISNLLAEARSILFPSVEYDESQKTANKIIDTVCEYFQISPQSIKEHCKPKEIVTARQYCMYFLKKRTRFSLKFIGKQFGKDRYDHTTVIYNVKKIDDFILINDYPTIVNIDAIGERLDRQKIFINLKPKK